MTKTHTCSCHGKIRFDSFQVDLFVGWLRMSPTQIWKLSKRIFPWHEHVWVFVMAFLLVHIVSLVLDPYAKVGLFASTVIRRWRWGIKPPVKA